MATLLSSYAFLAILDGAFDVEAASDEENVSLSGADSSTTASGYAQFATVIVRQVTDFREMSKSGTFDQPYHYLGTEAPSGESWNNFDVPGFLECVAAGTFGYWHPDEVPQSVASPAEHQWDRALEAARIEDNARVIENFTWDDFAEFLSSGQVYE